MLNSSLISSKLFDTNRLNFHSLIRVNQIVKLTGVFVLLVFFSCRKENAQEDIKPNKATSEVNFTVTGFTHEIKDFSSTKQSSNTVSAEPLLKEQINQLAFIIYNENGDEVSREIQFSDNEDFGRYKKSLAWGQYTVVIVGSKKSFGINWWLDPFTTPPVLAPLSRAKMMYESRSFSPNEREYSTDDTFFKKLAVVVEPDVTLNPEIELERIVGKLELNVEDSDYLVKFYNEALDFDFATEKPSNYHLIDYSYGDGNVTGSAGKTLSLYILRTDRPVVIGIETGGGENRGGITKSVTVPIFRNKTTVVSGRLLDVLKVSVNDQWDTDTLKVRF